MLDKDCTNHATMATKINTPRIFLPTKNTKILPTKFNMHMAAQLLLKQLLMTLMSQIHGVVRNY